MPSKESRLRAKTAEMGRMDANRGKTCVVDATGAIAGRLASHLAKRLLLGESIVVVNSEQAVVTGAPRVVKARYLFKTTVGTSRKGPFPSRMPHLMLKRTVRGMLPYQLPNGRAALKRLVCHLGVPAEFQSSKIERIDDAVRPYELGMTLGEVAQYLGKDIEVKPTG